MPEFIPFAGFSPNCCAVLVQMEHCPWTELERSEREMMNADMMNHLFMCSLQN